MAYWRVIVPAEQYAVQRLRHHDTIELAIGPGTTSANAGPGSGDEVLLEVLGEPPLVFGAGRVTSADGVLVIEYTRRSLDSPRPIDDLGLDQGVPTGLGEGALRGLGEGAPTGLDHCANTGLGHGAGAGPDHGAHGGGAHGALDEGTNGGAVPLTEAAYRAAVARLGPPAKRQDWLVSVHLPIEAESAADAVRRFWAYVLTLGPRELPAFVAPATDELAMRAYVLGVETELDPEDADEDTPAP